MKMCGALARDHEVMLFCPTATGDCRPADIYRFYGVQPTFSIVRLPRRGSGISRMIHPAQLLRWQIALGRFDLVYARCNTWEHYHLHKIKRHMISERTSCAGGDRLTSCLCTLGCAAWWSSPRACDATMRKLTILATSGCGRARWRGPGAARQLATLAGSNSVRCGYVGNLYSGKGWRSPFPYPAIPQTRHGTGARWGCHVRGSAAPWQLPLRPGKCADAIGPLNGPG